MLAQDARGLLGEKRIGNDEGRREIGHGSCFLRNELWSSVLVTTAASPARSFPSGGASGLPASDEPGPHRRGTGPRQPRFGAFHRRSAWQSLPVSRSSP